MILECIDCGGGPIEANDRCASCNAAHRKSERNSKKVKVVAPIKKVSESRSAELVEYRKLRKDFLLHRMLCELRFPGCFLTSSQVHHNSLSAINFLNTATWSAVCANCHKKLETEMSAEDRRQLGLLIN